MTFWTQLTRGIIGSLMALLLFQSVDYLPSITPLFDQRCELDQEDIVIHGDNKGHFRGRALINGVSMPFLIDTGATTTAIPSKLAKAAKLPIGETGMVSTANGLAEVQATEIKELKLGNAIIKNTEAAISDQLDEVLIGMSALKHFQVRFENNTLILVANKGYGIDITEEKKWKKNVVCNNDGGECKTVYSH
ncbi:MAG: retropepsin-like aspartic protease [Methylovulum sp.]|nr:retropepsin-like aspartic protease [Methylovulum sp.]